MKTDKTQPFHQSPAIVQDVQNHTSSLWSSKGQRFWICGLTKSDSASSMASALNFSLSSFAWLYPSVGTQPSMVTPRPLRIFFMTSSASLCSASSFRHSSTSVSGYDPGQRGIFPSLDTVRSGQCCIDRMTSAFRVTWSPSQGLPACWKSFRLKTPCS